MPRPVPSPENEKVRTTISLPARIVTAAKSYAVTHPMENLDGFSAIVSEALTEYLEKRHPGLVTAAAEMIRGEIYTAPEVGEGILAEDAGTGFSSDVQKILRRGVELERRQALGAVAKGGKAAKPNRAKRAGTLRGSVR